MATTLYAWSPITITDKVKGNGATMLIPTGDKVTKSQVGEDWDNLIAAGVLRTEKYPETRSDESPRNAKLRVLNEELARLTAPFQEGDTELGDDDNPDEPPVVT